MAQTMSKQRKQLFEKNVEEARQVVALLRLKNSHRMKVAQLALECSTIKHGGRNNLDRPTLMKFADKIGLNPRTLYEWTRQYRYVFLKLDAPRREMFQSVSSDNFKEIIKGVDADTPREKIRERFDAIAKVAPLVGKHNKYLRVLDTVIHNVSAFVRIHEIHTQTLLEYRRKAQIIITFIDKHLEAKEVEIPAAYKKPKINWKDFWTEEVGVD